VNRRRSSVRFRCTWATRITVLIARIGRYHANTLSRLRWGPRRDRTGPCSPTPSASLLAPVAAYARLAIGTQIARAVLGAGEFASRSLSRASLRREESSSRSFRRRLSDRRTQAAQIKVPIEAGGVKAPVKAGGVKVPIDDGGIQIPPIDAGRMRAIPSCW
jgi:hypothetical protein